MIVAFFLGVGLSRVLGKGCGASSHSRAIVLAGSSNYSSSHALISIGRKSR
jgi:hypothetical protein